MISLVGWSPCFSFALQEKDPRSHPEPAKLQQPKNNDIFCLEDTEAEKPHGRKHLAEKNFSDLFGRMSCLIRMLLMASSFSLCFPPLVHSQYVPRGEGKKRVVQDRNASNVFRPPETGKTGIVFLLLSFRLFALSFLCVSLFLFLLFRSRQ